MRAISRNKSRRSIANSLAYYFIPTPRQLMQMLLVAALGILVFAVVIGLRTNTFVRTYQAVVGMPMAVTHETWEIVPCPGPGNPNRLCEKYANTTQPSLFPPPTP